MLAATAQAYADAPDSSAAAPAAGVEHKIGDAFDYSIRGSMTQEITGHDTLGQRVKQQGTPTSLSGREHVAIQQISDEGMTLHRSGLIVAAVSNQSRKSTGKGWTLVRGDGTIARDSGNLGGVFLLPLPFLGENAVDAGAKLEVGSTWTDKLGTKLFGMTARPTMNFEVTGQHLALGVNVFEISAEGTAPMKEPVVSNSGAAMGYAMGTAQITMHGEYDPANHRMLSMEVELTDSLQLLGQNKHPAGVVGDHQEYTVELDPASLATSPLQSDNSSVEAPVTH
jgi:hypothetical protein